MAVYLGAECLHYIFEDFFKMRKCKQPCCWLFSWSYIVRHPKHIPITLVSHSPCEYYSSLRAALGIINVKQMLDAFPGAPALIAGVCYRCSINSSSACLDAFLIETELIQLYVHI